MVALVGENGSGKTTLGQAPRRQLFTPDRGRILWDGVDVATSTAGRCAARSADLPGLRPLPADRPREHRLRPGRCGRTTSTTIADAARQAGAHEFLERLPEGYETLLGKEFSGGYDLRSASGSGWRSRARSSARRACSCLDEPTASLDPRAEAELFEYMQALARRALGAADLAPLLDRESADRIYVLHDGEIVEEGTHAS